MRITPGKLNFFTFLNLPAAYFCGVRTKFIDDTKCVVAVTHRWINQNPFKSMFWAVQGMAAELSTGALVMHKIKATNTAMSMLVVSNKATFTKKATGRIMFTCNDGNLVNEAIKQATITGQGVTLWLKANGVNQDGIVVSSFSFEWSLKVKTQNK